MRNYYKVLGVSKNAALPKIKAAYRSLAREYHPDNNRGSDISESMMKMINEAYEILSDRQKRMVYDQIFREGKPAEASENIAEIVENKLQTRDPSVNVSIFWSVWWAIQDSIVIRFVLIGMLLVGLAYIISAGLVQGKVSEFVVIKGIELVLSLGILWIIRW